MTPRFVLLSILCLFLTTTTSAVAVSKIKAAHTDTLSVAPAVNRGIKPDTLKDRIFTAYALTKKQESTFDPHGKSISIFWTLWDANNLHTIWLTPYQEKYQDNRFNGRFDAQVVAKAAYGEKGLYFLFDVMDDNFPGHLDKTGINGMDAMDVILDRNSTAEIYANPLKQYFMPAWTLTKGYTQFQYSSGDKNPADSLGINRMTPGFVYDEAIDARNYEFCIQYRILSRADAEKQFGVTVKRVVVNQTRRMQEWFIPWRSVGVKGFEKKPLIGTTIAATFQYNDIDSGTLYDLTADGTPRSKRISWGGRGSPYDTCPRVWGDILLDGPAAKIIEISNARSASADSIFKPNGMGVCILADTMPSGLQKGSVKPGDFLYGTLTVNRRDVFFATSKWPFPDGKAPRIIDVEEMKKSQSVVKKQDGGKRLFIMDANLDRDLSNDPVVEWKPDNDQRKNFTVMYTLPMRDYTIRLLFDDFGAKSKHIGFRRADAVIGTTEIAGKSRLTVVWDERAKGYSLSSGSCFIGIDIDGDGRINNKDGSNELFTTGAPVVVDGMRFEVESINPLGTEITYKNDTVGTYTYANAGIGGTAPDFSGIDQHNRRISLTDSRNANQYTLLYFFSDDCGACRDLNSKPVSLIETLRFVMSRMMGKTAAIGVKSGNETLPRPKEYPTIWENGDWKAPILQEYHIYSMPTLICVNKKGGIVYRGYPALGSLWDALGRKDLDEAVKLEKEFCAGVK